MLICSVGLTVSVDLSVQSVDNTFAFAVCLNYSYIFVQNVKRKLDKSTLGDVAPQRASYRKRKKADPSSIKIIALTQSLSH